MTTEGQLHWAQTVSWLIYKLVVPTELVLALLCQLFNLYILQRMPRMPAYTVYLRTLSVVYLLITPLLLLSVARKNAAAASTSGIANASNNASSRVVDDFMLIYGTFAEPYLINVLLLTGNLIIVLIAAEAVYSLVSPIKATQRSDRSSRLCIAGALLLSCLLLLPIVCNKQMIKDEFGDWEIRRRSQLLKVISQIIRGIFEVVLVLLISVVYALMYVQHGLAIGTRKHGSGTALGQKHTSAAASARTSSNTSKALIMCTAPVLAYICSNMPSALKEAVYLFGVLSYNERLLAWFRSPIGRLVKDVANAALLANFILFVVLQYFARAQYQRTCQRDIKRQLSSIRHKVSHNSHRHSSSAMALGSLSLLPNAQSTLTIHNGGSTRASHRSVGRVCSARSSTNTTPSSLRSSTRGRHTSLALSSKRSGASRVSTLREASHTSNEAADQHKLSAQSDHDKDSPDMRLLDRAQQPVYPSM